MEHRDETERRLIALGESKLLGDVSDGMNIERLTGTSDNEVVEFSDRLHARNVAHLRAYEAAAEVHAPRCNVGKMCAGLMVGMAQQREFIEPGYAVGALVSSITLLRERTARIVELERMVTDMQERFDSDHARLSGELQDASERMHVAETRLADAENLIGGLYPPPVEKDAR